jgi:hypothetical protein
MPGAEPNPEPEREPSTTKSLAFSRHPAFPSTCRRRALGEPHDSRLLSARSLAISARARRGSVLMHYQVVYATALDVVHAARPFASPIHPCPPGPVLAVPSVVAARLAPKARSCVTCPYADNDHVSFGPQSVGGLTMHAKTSLVSSGIVVGPSRLNKPIGWPRKAGSTSTAPCSPLAI